MRRALQHWLNDLHLTNPIERRQAFLLQILLLIVICGGLIGLPVGVLTADESHPPIVQILSYVLLIVCTAGALAFLRYGRFGSAVSLALVGQLAAMGLALVVGGLNNGGNVLLSFVVPITLAGLLLGRRGLLLAAGASMALVVVTGLFEEFAPSLVSFTLPTNRSPFALMATFILIMGVLSLFLDRFGLSLRDALTIALNREQELERLRDSLEATVAERTAALQQALQDVGQREATLSQTLADLRSSEAVIRELSAPVIPVLPGVLVVPLIGALDSARADVLSRNVLAAIEQLGARDVIFDITGVPLVDTHVAQVLIDAALATRLLGASPALVGIRPEVAQTIMALNIDLSVAAVYPSLQEAVASLLGGAMANDIMTR
jgi:rsbT co-antagonist protein RsbR